MSSVVKTLFGGSDDSSLKSQQQANANTQRWIEQQTHLARDDAAKYIPRGANEAMKGFESAFNLQKQTIPAQLSAIRGGNIRAQESLLGGLGAANASIMGQPVDPNALKVANLGPDTANIFRNAQMPDFQPVQAGGAPGNGVGPPAQQPDIAALLAALQANGGALLQGMR